MIDALDEGASASCRDRSPRSLDHRRTHRTRRGYRDYDAARRARRATQPPPRMSTSRDDDIYNIIYSSGTTGSRRASSTRTTCARSTARCSRRSFASRRRASSMHAGSLVFNGAFVTLMPAWYLGCTFVLQEKFDARRVHRDGRARARHARDDGAVADRRGDQRAELLGRASCESLEMLCSVGAPWHREHKEKLLPVLPDSLYELYGLTEGFITVLDSKRLRAKDRLGRDADRVQRDAHRRRRRATTCPPAKSVRSSAALR